MVIKILIDILITLFTAAAMEGVAWAMHKYLFHGPLWFLHKSHHQKRHGWFELNDLFSIFFTGVSLWLIWLGHFHADYRLFIGIGVSIYGMFYFICHDWYVHNRVKPFKTNSRYLKGIRRAHKMHHKSTQKYPSEEFGFLLASRKWFKD